MLFLLLMSIVAAPFLLILVASTGSYLKDQAMLARYAKLQPAPRKLRVVEKDFDEEEDTQP